MNSLVAKQPILDTEQNVFAYELLFRGGDIEDFDGETATAQVIINSLESIGFNNLTSGKPAFINFTEKLLKQGIPDLLTPEEIYIEVLEDVKVDEHLLYSLRTYKEMGFNIVLDDFTFSKDLISLVKLADYVKIDFMLTRGAERYNLVDICRKYNPEIKFIGEKIESYDEYTMACDIGCELFQGYYFTRPQVIKGKKHSSYEFTFFKIMEELNKEEPKVKEIEKIIKTDFSMSYSLLRIINSAQYGYDVKSIRQAIVLLGIDKLKKWIFLYFLKGLDKDRPDILFKTSVLRASFAENLGEYFNTKKDLFVMGLFSFIDVYLNRQIEDVLSEISLHDDFKKALINEEGKFGDLLKLIKAFEKLNMEECSQYTEKYSFSLKEVADKYIEALETSNKIVKAFSS